MANEYPKNLLSKLIIVALNEWQKLNIENKANSQLNSDEKTHKLLQLLPNISETLQRTASQELEKMEQNVSFLATTGSVSPFLGLLGTVWGILSAFLSVRHIPVVTLQVIAPGISDALVTTVVGLLVAIPAVIAYNYFIGKIKNISDEIDRWSLEIIGDIRKKIVEE
ncbi:MAG: MotA/TolQ/ExbB proton channel family protein [candidate division WOR-3 bacterium]